MCGIAGILGNDSDSLPMIRQMMDAVRHRGPDDAGLLHGEEGITLGHRRLAIVGLEDGRQPISNEDGTIHIVCNGIIYNWRELRAELEKNGHVFATGSDVEVILHLYEDFGVQCLGRLRGMFSFAIWDSVRGKLFCARDHLGQKPFFYHAARGKFVFASEIKSILAAYPELRKLDKRALDQYLALRIIASPLTMFEDICKLPPAHYIEVDRKGRYKIERYWDLQYEPKNTASEPQLLDELDSLMIDSLAHHMVSDVPVGAFLSGGIDSGLLVSMLGKHVTGEGLRTFSMGIPYGKYDEAPAARVVAESIGADHHEFVVTPSLLDLLPDIVWHLDEPSDSLSVCAYLLSRETAKHVKVVIGGDGGDELFGGYDRYYGNLYTGHYAQLPEWLRRNVIGKVLDLLPDGQWYKSPVHRLKWLHANSFRSSRRRYARSLSYFYFDDLMRQALHGPRLRRANGSLAPYDCIDEPYGRIEAESPVDRMLYADIQCRMPDHPVFITDRMGMAFGLEARSPYLDPSLAEFAATLPVDMKVRGLSLRYLQKKLAARYLPEEVLRRPKQGFSVALPYLLRDEYLQLFTCFLTRSRLVEEEYLDGEIVAAILAEHMAGRSDHGSRLWLLLNAEVWYRMHIDGLSREDLYRVIDRSVRAGKLSDAGVPQYA